MIATPGDFGCGHQCLNNGYSESKTVNNWKLKEHLLPMEKECGHECSRSYYYKCCNCDPRAKGIDPCSACKLYRTKEEIDGPEHYNGYEVLKAICNAGYGEGFCLGNAVKYILRARKKGALEKDLKKAKFYLDWFLDKELNKDA